MKNLKKILASLTAVFMMLVCFGTVSVHAVSGNNGTITISDAVNGKSYNAYEVFKLDVDNATNPTAFKYYLTSDFAGLNKYETTVERTDYKASDYFTIDSNNLVTWKDAKNDKAGAAEFAILVKAFIESKGADLTATKGPVVASNSTVKFTNLELGYYFVSNNAGAICSLTTTDPDATLTEKNPSNDTSKNVQEDSDLGWGLQNDAHIGQDINFKTTLTINGTPKEKYRFVDVMDSGLDYKEETVEVYVGSNKLTTEKYTVVENKDQNKNDINGFTIEIISETADLAANDVITVKYMGVLTTDAEIKKPYTNTVDIYYLEKGEWKKINRHTTDSYTWGFNLNKYTTEKDADNKDVETKLSGAKFELYEGDTQLYFTYSNTTNTYTVVATGTADATGTITSNGSDMIIKGLDSGIYTLKETKAPDGYNAPEEDITIEIASNDKYDEQKSTENQLTASIKMNRDAVSADENGVVTLDVENNKGSMLPSTGGMGTTILYIAGGILVIGAAIFFVTNKRMQRN